MPSACPARYYVNCVDLHYTSRIKSTFVKRELSLKIEQIQYDTYSSISYVIDLNHHLALSPLISPPYILNFGCQPYSIIYGGFFHHLSFSLLIRLAYGFYRKLRFPIIKKSVGTDFLYLVLFCDCRDWAYWNA